MDLAQAIKTTPWWTDEDVASLFPFGREINANPAHIANVMAAETGLYPNAPRVWNATKSNAVGLCQITKVRAEAMRITEAERQAIRDMTVKQQLPWMLRAFKSTPWVQQKKPFKSAAHLYLLNFAPAYMDKIDDRDFVCYRDNPAKNWYPAKQNPAINPKGLTYINVGMIVDYADKCATHAPYQAMLTRLQRVDPSVAGSATIGPATMPGLVSALTGKGPVRGYATLGLVATVALTGLATYVALR